jgi:hypothetical protein
MLRRVSLAVALSFLCTMPMTLKADTGVDVEGSLCNQTVTEQVIKGLMNVTFFNTCAEGSTFSMKSLLDLQNFTEANFTSFCNSSVCVKALHSLHEEAPKECLITLEEGKDPINASTTLGELHHACHATQHEHNDSSSNDSSSSSLGFSTQQISSKTFALTVLVSVVLASFLL